MDQKIKQSDFLIKVKGSFFWSLVSVVAGAITTLAFAPFDLSWLVFFTLALVFYLWSNLPAKQASISAWLFGLGLQCSGVSWIYYSLHVHGSAPAFFAITPALTGPAPVAAVVEVPVVGDLQLIGLRVGYRGPFED